MASLPVRSQATHQSAQATFEGPKKAARQYTDDKEGAYMGQAMSERGLKRFETRPKIRAGRLMGTLS